MNWYQPKVDMHPTVTHRWIEIQKQQFLLKPLRLRAMDGGLRMIHWDWYFADTRSHWDLSIPHLPMVGMARNGLHKVVSHSRLLGEANPVQFLCAVYVWPMFSYIATCPNLTLQPLGWNPKKWCLLKPLDLCCALFKESKPYNLRSMSTWAKFTIEVCVTVTSLWGPTPRMGGLENRCPTISYPENLWWSRYGPSKINVPDRKSVV